MEEWKDVAGYEEYFKISTFGNLFSKRTNKSLKTYVNSKGYEVVATKFGGRNGTNVLLRVHRLVAATFIENKENKPFVNHIDGDKSNNTVENLEWCTSSENMIHAVETGLKVYSANRDDLKTTKEDAEFIIKTYIPYCRYNGSRALGRLLGISHSCVLRIIHGTRKENYKVIETT